jgi:N-acetylmuramoyl-L-alanine amidase
MISKKYVSRFIVVLLAIGAALLLCDRRAAAAAVTKISWDSKPKYNRFVMQFDEYLKYNVVDAIKDKGYFYIDIYGITTNYKRRLLKVNDNVVKYVDAVCYPEHSVLRLVFYTTNLNCAFKVSRTPAPARIVVDTVKDTTINIDAKQFSEPVIASESKSSSMASLGISAPANAVSAPVTVQTTPVKVPPIPEPRLKPMYASPGKKKCIIIDAGHGGENSGATSNNLIGGRKIAEKELTLQFAYHLKRIIDQSPNMVGILTRTDDRIVSLEDRVRFAENHQGDFFISIHMNDGGGNRNARGMEIYYLDEKGTVAGAEKAVQERENLDVGGNSKSRKGTPPLLKTILTDLERRNLEDWQYESWVMCKRVEESFQDLPFYRQFNRGIKSANFVVLKNYSMPAVLLEVGFITNREDLQYLINPQFQQATAIMTYNALNNYFAECDPGFNSQTINVSSVISR